MVEIFESTDRQPLQKMGRFAGICWNSPVNDEEKNVRRAKDCIASGHGRVLEYVDIELCISGYSARAIREYYTHIAGAPTRLQESTRYVDCGSFTFFTPSAVRASPEARSVYEETMDFIRRQYASLLERGVSREDAANVLPLGMMTKIVDKRNLRNMVNLMNQRLCGRAYSEIRSLAEEIKSALSGHSDEWKWICGTLFVPKCDVGGFCAEKNGCGRRPQKTAELR